MRKANVDIQSINETTYDKIWIVNEQVETKMLSAANKELETDE